MKTYIIGTGNYPIFKDLLAYKSDIVIFNSVSSLLNTLRSVNFSSHDLPDMVLGDLEAMSGDKEQEIRRLMSYLQIHAIPCLALSSQVSEIAKAKALHLGCNDIYSYDDSIEKITHRVHFLKSIKQYQAKAPVNVKREESVRLRMPFFKRAFDIMFSLLILLMLSPLLLVVALLIKLESHGPVFYISKRAGTGYKVFDFYKFRTMKNGADKDLANLLALNQYGEGKSAFVKINNDPRVTRVGAFLRKTSIDEIPQLINVLKGDMSIVGNRPLPLYEAEILTDDKSARRFLAPAGITGLWQVTKRGKKEMSEIERKELDVNYAVNWDVWSDFKILLKTIPALLQKEAV